MVKTANLLSLPRSTRDALIHEKARARAGRAIVWVRSYVADLDDFELQRETIATRFLARELPLLIVRADWHIPDDPRWIAGRLSIRTEDAKRSTDRLVSLGRIVRVQGEINANGLLQSSLFSDLSLERQGERVTSDTPSDPPSDLRARPLATTNGSAQPSDAAALLASHGLAQSRAEQKREELQAEQKVEAEEPALPSIRQSTSPALLRLAALGARSDPASQSVIITAATGLPEAGIARAAESYIGRRPRPRNPAGYIVATLQALRAEYGLEPLARVEREPEL